MKARRYPHENRDHEKGSISSDSANVQFSVIKLLVRPAIFFKFIFGCIDIRAAYLQGGPILRDIYTQPTKDCNCTQSTVCKLKKLPYGLRQAERQWTKTAETWLLLSAGLNRVNGIFQLYTKTESSGDITTLLVKPTDHSLLVDNELAIRSFMSSTEFCFLIEEILVNSEVRFNGCIIR